MSSYGLKVSNVTVDKAVRSAEEKILEQILNEILNKIPNPIATALDDSSFIDFNNINVSKERIITEEEAKSMVKSGVIIVNYTRPNTMNPSDPFTILFPLQNNLQNVDNIISIFNLSTTTPSRLIRVIRSGINTFSPIADTILGIIAVVAPTDIKYIYFQVNGIDGTGVIGGDNSTKLPVFLTYSDWSFVVSLKFYTIDGQTYNRICFNVLV